MGRSPTRDWFFIDLSGAVATLAQGANLFAGVTAPGYSCAGFTRGFVLAQISSVQTNADVRRGETDQRR